MTAITTITVTLSTLLLAAEFPVSDTDAMDSADHARLGDPAVAAVEEKLSASYPEAEIEVTWSRDAMMRHAIEAATADGPCGIGDRELTDVRDDVLEALCDHLAA